MSYESKDMPEKDLTQHKEAFLRQVNYIFDEYQRALSERQPSELPAQFEGITRVAINSRAMPQGVTGLQFGETIIDLTKIDPFWKNNPSKVLKLEDIDKLAIQITASLGRTRKSFLAKNSSK